MLSWLCIDHVLACKWGLHPFSLLACSTVSRVWCVLFMKRSWVCSSILFVGWSYIDTFCLFFKPSGLALAVGCSLVHFCRLRHGQESVNVIIWVCDFAVSNHSLLTVLCSSFFSGFWKYRTMVVRCDFVSGSHFKACYGLNLFTCAWASVDVSSGYIFPPG